MKLFAVLVQRVDGGHGPFPAIVQITTDAEEAVRTARDIEHYGYFASTLDGDHGIRIDQINSPEIIRRGGVKTIYSRRLPSSPGPYVEYFWDGALANTFQMTRAFDFSGPSQPLKA